MTVIAAEFAGGLTDCSTQYCFSSRKGLHKFGSAGKQPKPDGWPGERRNSPGFLASGRDRFIRPEKIHPGDREKFR